MLTTANSRLVGRSLLCWLQPIVDLPWSDTANLSFAANRQCCFFVGCSQWWTCLSHSKYNQQTHYILTRAHDVIMCSDTDNEVHRFAEDDDKVENLSIKSFPSDIESQCCHEFQTTCLAEENKNTWGEGGKLQM